MEWRNRAFYVFGGVELLLDFLGVGDVFFVVAAERAERVVEVFGGGVGEGGELGLEDVEDVGVISLIPRKAHLLLNLLLPHSLLLHHHHKSRPPRILLHPIKVKLLLTSLIKSLSSHGIRSTDFLRVLFYGLVLDSWKFVFFVFYCWWRG